MPAFQIYTGLLFGLPLTGSFTEAAGRGLLLCLVPVYFDDAHLTDWGSSKGSSQWAFSELNKLLGSPFAEDKKQAMAAAGTFLGLDFDFTSSLRSGQVRFFVRERLVSKVLDMVDTAVAADHLPSGQAAKLYGVCNFLEQGMYGCVGAGGLAAVRKRADLGGGGLTPPIRSSLELIRSVVDARPSRVFELFTRELPGSSLQVMQRRMSQAKGRVAFI